MHYVLTQYTGSPLTKLYRSLRVHPVSNRENGIEVVVRHFASNPPLPFGSNYEEILLGCLPVYLAGSVDVVQVHADVSGSRAKYISHLLPCQPDSLPVQSHI